MCLERCQHSLRNKASRGHLTQSPLPHSHVQSLAEAEAYDGPLAVMITEPDGRTIRHVNRAWTALCGFLREDSVGRSMGIIQGALTSRPVSKAIGQACRKGVPVEAYLVNYRADRTAFANHVYAAPLAADAGHGAPRCFMSVLEELRLPPTSR